MNISRTNSLVKRAFWNFLGASILTTVAAQLAVSVDAVIVSHLIGPHAMAAVNMVMPLLTVFLSLNSLLGVGASLLAAKAIGAHDTQRASRIFTASLYSVAAIGVLVSAVTFGCCDSIAQVLCPDAGIRPMVLSYLRVTTLGVTVMVMSGMLNMMVQSDGRPRLVTRAVLTGAVANIALDYVFIRFFAWGIAGSAWATIVNYTLTALIVATHLRRPSCSYRILRPAKWLLSVLKVNVAEGVPLMIANVMLGVIVFLINIMVDGALGADGLYMVAVCLQLLMITFVVLNGVVDAMFAIGGAMLGEGDLLGLRMLNRVMLLFAGALLLAFTLLVAICPQVFAAAFGARDAALHAGLCRALRIFSLILLPFSFTVLMRATFQTLGHRLLSTLLVVGQLMAIVSCLWAFAQWAEPDALWWSFPLSAVLLLVVQVAVTWWLSRRAPGTSPFTLLPQVPSTVLDASVTCALTPALEQGIEQMAPSVARPVAAHLSAMLAALPPTAKTDVHLSLTATALTLTLKSTAPLPQSSQSFGLSVHRHTFPLSPD